MNPDELAARNAIMQRLIGNPQGGVNALGPGSGQPVAPPMPQAPLHNDNIGVQSQGKPKIQVSPTASLIKGLLPATAGQDYHPEIQGMSKVLLTKLIPYL